MCDTDLGASTTTATPPPALGAAGTVLEINGAIGPGYVPLCRAGLDAAQKAGSRFVILEVDTPGGLDTSMRDIIRAILASPVPVVTYVSPPGARAASAGTYILYASHIAAMAPATNLGAATPVSIGGESPPEPNPTPAPNPASDPEPHGGSNPPAPKSKAAPVRATTPPGPADLNAVTATTPQPPRPPQPATAMERKVINDAVAYIRGLAELRGRNADWAEQAVRGAASLSATAALQQNVIDVVARTFPIC